MESFFQLILVETAVFCHYRPLVALGVAALLSKAVFYILQGFLYATIPNSSNLQVMPIKYR